MTNEKVETLIDKYESLFYFDGKLHPANYGIACGDGWYDLLFELLLLIESHLAHKKPTSLFQISQVKEKFGGLRFYYDEGDDYIDGLVRLAENLSYKTCETCGSNQHIGMTSGWLKVRCKSCAENESLENWKEKDRSSIPITLTSKS